MPPPRIITPPSLLDPAIAARVSLAPRVRPAGMRPPRVPSGARPLPPTPTSGPEPFRDPRRFRDFRDYHHDYYFVPDYYEVVEPRALYSAAAPASPASQPWASDGPTTAEQNKKIAIAVGASVGGVALLSLIVLVVFLATRGGRRRR